MHHANSDFWTCYKSLPKEVRQLADKAFALLKENPRHRSLRFKKIHDYWSVRISDNYRALANEVPDGLVWFWIGTHAEYEWLIDRARG